MIGLQPSFPPILFQIKMAHMNHASTTAMHMHQKHLLPTQFYCLNEIPIDFKINQVSIFTTIGNLFSDVEIKPETDTGRQIFFYSWTSKYLAKNTTKKEILLWKIC